MQGMNAKNAVADRVLAFASAHKRATAAVALVAGIVAAVVGLVVVPAQHEGEAEATGEVVAVDTVRHLLRRVRHEATVVFEVDGKTYEFTTRHRIAPRVGDEVTVFFDPADPSGTAHRTHWGEALGVAGLVAALGGAAALVIRRQPTPSAERDPVAS